MKKFRERRRFKRALYSKLSIAVLIIAVFFLGKSVWGSWQKYSATSASRYQAQVRVNELKDQKEALEMEIERLRTDQGKEATLRDRFDVGAPGEEVINIVTE